MSDMGIDNNWAQKMNANGYRNTKPEHYESVITILPQCIISKSRIWEYRNMLSLDHVNFALEFLVGENLIRIKNVGDEEFMEVVENFWRVKKLCILLKTEKVQSINPAGFETQQGLSRKIQYAYGKCKHALVYSMSPATCYIYIKYAETSTEAYIPFNTIIWNNLEKNMPVTEIQAPSM